ncbi:MAG: hypothetical protein GXY05_16680 [Clostridiales bacterium]|nr:hypothetical protein [Clostridiales bacterium]
MDTSMLLDSWEKVGSNYDDFARIIADIDASTRVFPADTSGLTLYAVTGTDESGFKMLEYDAAQTVSRNLPKPFHLNESTIIDKGATEDFLGEIKRSRLIIKIGEAIFYTSRSLSRDLGARASVSGSGLNSPSPERNAFFMHRYVADPCKANIVMRKNKEGTLRKIFAMPSAGYRHIPQVTLLELAEYFGEEMGGIDTQLYNVNHFISQIWIDFPKQAEDVSRVYKLPDVMIPGVLLETSDTGDCALKVIPTWRRSSKHTYVRANEYKREHKGSFVLEDVKNKIKESIFSIYTKLPARLCELLSIDVPNPGEMLESIFDSIGMEALLKKTRADSLLTQLKEEIDTTANYTAYDLVMRLMDLPALFESDKWLREQVEAAAYKAPFLDFGKLSKKFAPITLTA